MFGTIFLSALISFLLVMIPRWILMRIKGEGASFLKVLLFIACIEASLFLLKCLRDYLRGRSKLSSECLFREAYADLSAKQATISYVDAIRKESIDSLEGGKYGIFAGPQLAMSMEMMGSSVVSMAIDAVIIAAFDWRLLVIPVAVNCVLIPFYKKVRTLEVDNAKRLRPENRAFGWYCRIISDFQYGKDLRIYQSQAFILQKCRELMKRIFAVNQESFSQKGILLGAVKALLQLQIVVIAILLAVFGLKGMSTADFVFVFGAICGMSSASNSLMEGMNKLRKFDVLMEPFFTFINKKDEGGKNDEEAENSERAGNSQEIENSEGVENSQEAENSEGAGKDDLCIEFTHVSFAYPGREILALSDICCTFHSGENIGLIGTNGAGKSTMVMLLCRLYAPSKGKITMNGKDIWEMPLFEYRKYLSTLFQDFQLLPVQVIENITCKMQEEIGSHETAAVYDLLRQSNLSKWLATLPEGEKTYVTPYLSEVYTNPSGGQKQYLAVARAVYHRTQTCIFDEPTMALDIREETAVLETLEKLCRDKLSILISHRLSHTRFVDRIIVMDHGEIAEEGTHKQLMEKKGLYCTMYQTQAKRYL